MPRPSTVSQFGPLLAAFVLVFAGCEDEPEECTRPSEGESSYEVLPEATTTWSGTLESTFYYSNAEDPTYQYVFRLANSSSVTLLVPDIGVSVPVVVAGAYSVVLEQAGIDPFRAYGVRITDAQGLRYLSVSDWKPNEYVFEDTDVDPGYALNGPDRLVVAKSATCDPIQENTEDYRLLRNATLVFQIEGVGSTQLDHGETATLGDWVIHVHKAIEAQPKRPELIQNQISFYVERRGLR